MANNTTTSKAAEFVRMSHKVRPALGSNKTPSTQHEGGVPADLTAPLKGPDKGNG